jgi:hypothetical protein
MPAAAPALADHLLPVTGRVPVGASAEVIHAHARAHACGEQAGASEVMCPCGQTVALVCTVCGEPVFLAVEPGTWCEHDRRAVARPSPPAQAAATVGPVARHRRRGR